MYNNMILMTCFKDPIPTYKNQDFRHEGCVTNNIKNFILCEHFYEWCGSNTCILKVNIFDGV